MIKIHLPIIVRTMYPIRIIQKENKKSHFSAAFFYSEKSVLISVFRIRIDHVITIVFS